MLMLPLIFFLNVCSKLLQCAPGQSGDESIISYLPVPTCIVFILKSFGDEKAKGKLQCLISGSHKSMVGI